MREKDIPAFVQEVVTAGCDICAVGNVAYVFGDADLPEPELSIVAPLLRRICETYGERDHLRSQIIAHLRSIGRYVDIAPADD